MSMNWKVLKKKFSFYHPSFDFSFAINYYFADKVLQLEQENLGLRSQISELVAEKENRNKQFESINVNYETKLQQLKVYQKRIFRTVAFHMSPFLFFYFFHRTLYRNEIPRWQF